MTIEEAIKAIRPVGFSIEGPARRVGEFIEALDISEDAMEELKKYREIGTLEELNSYMNQSEEEFDMLVKYIRIGTIEECRVAVEKQKPMKPVKTDIKGYRYIDTYRCPTCGGNFSGTGIAYYCYHCGQRLDWSEDE